MIEIETTCCKDVICSGETAYHAVKEAVEGGVSLGCADLHGLDLRGIYFCGADLERANLTDCKLQRCDFRDAVLTGTNFSGSNVSGAKMVKAIWNKLKSGNFMWLSGRWDFC